MIAPRKPAVAGTFYPADPVELAARVDDLLGGPPADSPHPWGLVVPHAALLYSGRIAALAYRTLDRSVRHVVLIGPAHRIPVDGMAVPEAGSFNTPLGAVPIDTRLRENALRVPGVVADDAPHVPEHSLEVQLPFLQRVLPDFTVLPVVAGDPSDAAVERLIDSLGDDTDTVIVASTDLSHGLPDAAARTRDAITARAIVALEPDRVRWGDACGQAPLRGLLRAARSRQLRVQCLGLANSADAGGPTDAVVGYGAFAMYGTGS